MFSLLNANGATTSSLRMNNKLQLEQAISRIEAQRSILGSAVADAAVAALREKLATLAVQENSAGPRRRQVTVLFADIADFTALAETMDVEDVSEVMNSLWSAVDRIIVDHGGRIDKHMGDGLMALWGSDQAREDDPEQAIRAALAIQQEAAAQRFTLTHQGNGPAGTLALHLRIGVHTGPVMLSELGLMGEFTAVGDTVNTASRLQEQAPAGRILISHSTYRHVRGLFEVQPLDPVRVRGKAEPLQMYLVQWAKPRAFRLRTRGVEGIETHMIGRERELAYLQSAFSSMLNMGTLQFITVSGEAGLGKSRLLYELEGWTELQPEIYRLFRGRANQTTRHLPFSLLRDLFAFRFGVQDSDPPDAVWRKIEEGLTKSLGNLSQEQARLVGYVLGFDLPRSGRTSPAGGDARQMRDQAFHFLHQFFQQVTATRPAAILLEDVHWADEGSLDWIEYQVRQAANLPLLIICLARPELFERRPNWGENAPTHTHLPLQPLTPAECRQLVRDILRQVVDVPQVLEEMAVSHTGGNPFYVEELIKTFIDDGAIHVSDERWQIVPERLVHVRVPSTLVGVLQSRLERLPPAALHLLQRAAVIGNTFWDEALAFLQEQPAPEGEDEAVLRLLVEKELIFSRAQSAFAGAQEYSFKHMLLREVVYEQVLKRQRRLYHERTAHWLMARSRERASEYLGLIAEHLQQAGEVTQAVDYLRRAGERAMGQYATGEALVCLSRALELLPAGVSIERFDLLLAREQVYHLQGRREAQQQDLDQLQRLADALAAEYPERPDTSARLAYVALRRARLAETTGDYPATTVAAQAAIRHALAVADGDALANGYLLWARALWRQGNYEAARGRLQQALKLAQETGLRRTQADILRNLGVVAWYQARNAECKQWIQQALAIYREIGDRQGVGAALNNLGVVYVREGAYTDARLIYEESLRIKQEMGDRQGAATTLINLSDISARHGLYEAERDYSERALAIYQEVGDRNGEARTLYNLTLLFCHLEEFESARQYAERALAITREIGDRSGQGHALANMGQALLGLGALPAAAEAYQASLTLRQQMGQHNYALESLAGLAEVALACNELEQAQNYVETLMKDLPEETVDNTGGFFHAYLVSCRVLLANNDSRANTLLTKACGMLEAQAARILDRELRRAFLEDVAVHRELMALHQANHPA